MQPQNLQLELAFDYVNNTNANIFLTGKAGTGKTTFLHRIRKESVKRLAVVAPTGVAAINAGGVTIHSLFQLPFGPYLPGNSRDASRQRRFSGEKIRLIQSLDLLVIDEISMVRADLLDGIDEVLRRYRDFSKPFGGIQLLMIGDLHQLPPVLKDDDWELLRNYYPTPYFFSSRALQNATPVVIELKHIYRQSDRIFIELLNKVRERRIDADVLATLNSRYTPGFQPHEDEGYITLSTHNATAHDINAEKLAATTGTLYTFKAVVSDEFPAHAYPTDEELHLKIGAQVMFVKNDSSWEKRFYNGKIGKVTGVGEDVIYVRCPGEPEQIAVGLAEWQNIKYTLNETTKEVDEAVIGTFVQFPLKLAWAITIHKSQGLTFERVILDAQAAFAHGQVYVALSRCRSFEGIVLRSPIVNSSIRTDIIVKNYSDEAAKNPPDEAHLEAAKARFQQSLIHELFNLGALKKRLEQMERILLEHEKSLHPDAFHQFKAVKEQAETIFPVADKFRFQLDSAFMEGVLPEADEMLQARLRKAGAWFAEKTGAELYPASRDIRIVTDNKELRKTAIAALENLQEELFVKHACFSAVQSGFSATGYLRVKANSKLDFKTEITRRAATKPVIEAPQDVPHPVLYAALLQWRESMAEAFDTDNSSVVSTKSLLEIVQHLPLTPSGLKAIKGFGSTKFRAFGIDILQIVQQYCSEHNIRPEVAVDLPGVSLAKIPKPDTKNVSFDLFKSGKSVDEIALERGFVRGTIEGHLAHFIGLGELDIFQIMKDEEVRALENYFQKFPNSLSSDAKLEFGERFSYGEIKMVMTWMGRTLREP